MKTISLKYAGKCADCGAHLPAGTKAKYYGPRKIYGLSCHKKDGNPVAWIAGGRSGGMCEDAPCCGCCGPGTGGPGDYYQPDPPEPYDYGGFGY